MSATATQAKKFELPKHFMIGYDGALIDTRGDICAAVTVRERYAYHSREIKTPSELKATIRAGQFTWPGMYQLYFITGDGAAFCFKCARQEFALIARAIKEKDTGSGWRIVACEVNYEDNECVCAHCNQKIPAAYGEE